MNEKTSWDQSLVKKYSSSNHFKLLNQLRNEVKKYPLNKKKNISSNTYNESISEIKNSEISSIVGDNSFIKNSNNNKDFNNSNSTVSFNNSKDFSIYNNVNHLIKNEKKENNQLDPINSNEDLSTSTFKDRLNQIDLK